MDLVEPLVLSTVMLHISKMMPETLRRGGIAPALSLVVLASLLVSCKSSNPTSPYISPRVIGRVLDQQTHQPISKVVVSRVEPTQRNHDTLKGAQKMKSAPAVRTEDDGTFALASVRDLAPFRTVGWFSVDVSFEHSLYQRFVASYTLADATNSPSGEPLVKAGDIFLTRKAE